MRNPAKNTDGFATHSQKSDAYFVPEQASFAVAFPTFQFSLMCFNIYSANLTASA